jgi:hypothetical protein
MILPYKKDRFLAALGPSKPDYVDEDGSSGKQGSIKQSEALDCMGRFLAAVSAQDASTALEELQNVLAVLEMQEDD